MYALMFFDAHTERGLPNDRFKWLGNMIRRERPDIVVNGGDYHSFDSVSMHKIRGSKTDRNTQPIIRDIQEMIASDRTLIDAMGGYTPGRMVYLLGNHEERLDRFVEMNPEVDGTYDISKMPEFKHWEVHQYPSYVELGNDIKVAHAVMNARNKPIEGENAARMVAARSQGTIIFGHCHKGQVALSKSFAGTPPAMAVSAPCFMPQGYRPAYTKGSALDWTYGVIRVISSGGSPLPDIEFVSTDRLQRIYGQ